MGDLDEADADFRAEWTKRLTRALRGVSSLEITREDFEGATMLYKASLALHYTFEALSALPETRDLIEPLFDLQTALANARYGTPGPLQLSDPEARRERGRRGNPMSVDRRVKAACAAVAVELLMRADPPMKPTLACRTVAEIFASSGVRGERGGRVSKPTVTDWHTRSMDPTSFERAGVDLQLERLLPLTQEEALQEAALWAKEALFAQNMNRA